MDTWASPLTTCGPPEKTLRIKKIMGFKTAPHDRDGFGASEGGMDSKERRGMGSGGRCALEQVAVSKEHRGVGTRSGHWNKRRIQKSGAGCGQGRGIRRRDGFKIAPQDGE